MLKPFSLFIKGPFLSVDVVIWLVDFVWTTELTRATGIASVFSSSSLDGLTTKGGRVLLAKVHQELTVHWGIHPSVRIEVELKDKIIF